MTAAYYEFVVRRQLVIISAAKEEVMRRGINE